MLQIEEIISSLIFLSCKEIFFAGTMTKSTRRNDFLDTRNASSLELKIAAKEIILIERRILFRHMKILHL